MQLYNTGSPEVSIIHLLWDLCDANITSFPLASAVRNINTSLEELVGDIINSDGSYQYDDTNHTDLPIGKGTLVEGQQAYTFASEYLQVNSIEILDTANVYRRIPQVDNDELGGMSPSEYYGGTATTPRKGFPEAYDIVGDTIFLYPAPAATSVTLTNGIRIWFKRTVDLFTTADTTQAPGLPSTHHHILAYMAALPYCMKYHKDRVNAYTQKALAMKESLLNYYRFRNKDNTPKMTVRTSNRHI